METITASVGNKGRNLFSDVSKIQELLNGNLHKIVPLTPLDTDGKIGKITISAIETYQKIVLKMANPDGRVDPNGKTIRSLNSTFQQPINDAPISVIAKSSSAYQFPLKSRPMQSYKEGMRRFGSNRKGGRRHAGCDLYAPVGTPIYAMDDGEVLRDVYAFYLGTYALEVKHTNFIARYGEISRVAGGLKKGSKIEKGQLIGYVGELRGLNMSMLHLELYKNVSNSSRLTVRSNEPYRRRADLIDPSDILDRAKI